MSDETPKTDQPSHDETPEPNWKEYAQINMAELVPEMQPDGRRGSRWITAYAIAMIYLLISADADSVFGSIHPVMRRIEIILFMAVLLIQAVFLFWHRMCFLGLLQDRLGLGLLHLRMPWHFFKPTNPKDQLQSYAKKAELDHAEEYIAHAFISDLFALAIAVIATLLVVVTWW